MSEGILFICATPIGNLEDITLRVIRTLKECDAIACEDTRHSLRLLNHLGIKKPLFSYHQHNEQSRTEEILQRLEQGEKIALISDAGLPGISDPGFTLVKSARQQGFRVTVLPGASAGISALVLSGLPCDKFVFEGFLPFASKEKTERLKSLLHEERTVILYESPHRLAKSLEALYDVLGNRKIVLARELTKLYEESIELQLKDWEQYILRKSPKGEFVLILEGAAPVEESFSEISVEEQVLSEMKKGSDKKTAVKTVAKLRGLPKNDVYMQVTHIGERHCR